MVSKKKSISKSIIKSVKKIKNKISPPKTSPNVQKLKPKKLLGLGINVVLKHKDENSLLKYIEYLNELRVEWVRLELNYYDMVDDKLMDFFVEELKKSDIKILGLLTGLVPGTLVNCWIPSLNYKCPLDTIFDYKAYTERLCLRYKNQIKDWEIWNEPNTLRFWVHNPEPSEYVKLVSETSPIIKKINPQNKTYFGGLMGDDIRVIAPFQRINFIEDCIRLGIDPYIDVYNFHPYDPICYFAKKPAEVYFPTIKSVINSFLGKYSDIKKPFIISEIGTCPMWLKISQTEIGILYKDIYLHSKSKNVDCYFWVLTDFKGPEYSRWNPETAFGLIDWDLNPKLMYKSFVTELNKL
jgi:hypothetical protein